MDLVNVLYLRDARVWYAPGLAYATPGSAGMDLRACPEGDEDDIVIGPGERRQIPSGIVLDPGTSGLAGFVYSRSGLGAVRGLTVAQGVGVIDPDYRGEIVVWLLNTSGEERVVRRGDRIAQLVFHPIGRPMVREATEGELSSTERGAGGFGHTGRA